MNRKKIFSCFSNNLVFLFVILFNVQAQSQELKNDSIKGSESASLLRGIYIGADLFSPLNNLFGANTVSYELFLQANLMNRFFPIWEIGVGKGSKTNELGLNLQTNSALYNKIGLNYNVLNKNKEDFMYVGARLGYSSFTYSLDGISLSSGYWGDKFAGGINDQNASVLWSEMLAGIQVRVISNLYMGWNVAYKIKLKEQVDDAHVKPWYIPGYGTSNWSIMYHVMYKLPFL